MSNDNSAMPAAYHNPRGSLAFSDGHAESRKWSDPAMDDWLWLWQHDTEL